MYGSPKYTLSYQKMGCPLMQPPEIIYLDQKGPEIMHI